MICRYIFNQSQVSKFSNNGVTWLSPLQDGDQAVVKALLDFSYFTAIGNMEEAFKAVQAVRGPGLWENMAKMAIRNKRLDVAGQPALRHRGKRSA